jgi:hypothetical protein
MLPLMSTRIAGLRGRLAIRIGATESVKLPVVADLEIRGREAAHRASTSVTHRAWIVTTSTALRNVCCGSARGSWALGDVTLRTPTKQAAMTDRTVVIFIALFGCAGFKNAQQPAAGCGGAVMVARHRRAHGN